MYQLCTGLVIPSDSIEDKCSIALTSSLSKTVDNVKILVSANDFADNQLKLKSRMKRALCEILKEAQAEYCVDIVPKLISLSKMRNRIEFECKLNQ